ncbi:hypothetical protein PFRI_36330 [Planktotalea frisia]|uniref:Uncharacterized protein n=1 Tax=Planktotalea frisia TaxID=696762 RepID=A0A1L9NS74_9RHOB|nr:hypothetical protein PFRI_36330 [Planktotalea frisia]
MSSKLGLGRGGRTKSLVVQCVEIFLHCAWRIIGVSHTGCPIFRVAGVLFLDICTDQAGIDCKSLATHEPFRHAARNGRLKYVAQKVTLPEPTVAVLGKRRMIRDAVTKVQAAEPAIGQVQMNLFAQAALRADAGAIAHKQHPDHQFRINGWATSVAVKLGKMRTNTTQVNEPINRTQQVVLGNMIFQRKLIKQCCLRLLPWSQHRNPPVQ